MMTKAIRKHSEPYQLTGLLRELVLGLMASEGRNFELCEICGVCPAKEIHHTKYIGATYYDLQQVCLSCNRKAENCGLE